MMSEYIIQSTPSAIDRTIQLIENRKSSDQMIYRRDVYQKILELADGVKIKLIRHTFFCSTYTIRLSMVC